ncbi:MAG: FmdB family zinc ribbon protein [Thermoanaerobaculia bacterium]
MPLYEYLCASCKKKIEVLQGFNEKAIRNCPHCGGKLRKLMSSPAIQFKGSGWYVTDYASKSGSADKSSEKAPEKAADAKAEPRESKTDSKKPDKPAKKENPSKKD